MINSVLGVLEEEALWDAFGADFGASDNTGRGLLHVAAKDNATTFQKLI